MPRTQTQDPLLLATPTLQPTVRPLPVQIGATPAPRQSALMELSDSFRNFNAELRDLLRDTAAREEKDAQAIGEIEGEVLAREGRMAELDKVLKERAEKGEIATRFLPSAQRAAQIRAGHTLADVGLRDILAKNRAKWLRMDPAQAEQEINETFTGLLKTLPEGGVYERRGFVGSAAQILSSFRDSFVKERETEAERQRLDSLSQDGRDRLFALATADADAREGTEANLKAWLTSVRDNELLKSETNEVLARDMFTPLVTDLVNSGNFSAARQLVESMRTLDLTGKNGRFGQTQHGAAAIKHAEAMIESLDKNPLARDAERARDAATLAKLSGDRAADEALFRLLKANGGRLPVEQRQALLDEGLTSIADASAYAHYRDAINQAFQAQVTGDRAFNKEAGETLHGMVLATIDPKKLDDAEALLNSHLAAGTLEPGVATTIRVDLEKHRALSSLVKDSDVGVWFKETFAAPTPLGKTIGFADNVFQDAWHKSLDAADHAEIESFGTSKFLEVFRDQLRLQSGGNPQEADAKRPLAWQEAKKIVNEQVKAAILSRVEQKRQQATSAQTQTHAAGNKQARAVIRSDGVGTVPSLSYTVTERVLRPAGDVPGDKPAENIEEVAKNYFPVKAGLAGAAASASTDRAFRSRLRASSPDRFGAVEIAPADSEVGVVKKGIDLHYIDLKAVAKDILDEEALPQKRELARQLFIAAKSANGFSPDEVLKGEAFGVPLDVSGLRADIHSVFRSVAELNKHWNEGEPDDKFRDLLAILSPDSKLPPRDFYLAQRALLRARRLIK